MKIKEKILAYFDSQNERDNFVIEQLQKIKNGLVILDAGCGSQRYKEFCKHLIYKSQDFGGYSTDSLLGFASSAGGKNGYVYGEIDYLGDICNINEVDSYFDVILCTEVFEHISNPNLAVAEFSRLLRPGGLAIITAPSNCLRHMDPYFYYSGFTNRWFEKVLVENNFEIEYINQIGDYYKWLAVELGRAANHHSFFAKIILLPAFLYFFFKKANEKSKNTLCLGYHLVARKI